MSRTYVSATAVLDPETQLSMWEEVLSSNELSFQDKLAITRQINGVLDLQLINNQGMLVAYIAALRDEVWWLQRENEQLRLHVGRAISAT